ncbi:SDR family NAD(P)-dependent oxidoreductase [Entomoplasma freundtii]|nr:SDR family NAD(P)-dependent oxidoreductase [Entomoplasma freundtii]
MDKTKVMTKIGIVTGATGGLGHAFVQILMENDDLEEIWVIARDQTKLDSLKTEYGDKIRTWSLDLSDHKSFDTIKAALVKERNYDIIYLINCAGYGKIGDYSDLNITESFNMIDLNCGSILGMCVTCIPYMEAEAHIINIASQLSSFPTPYFAIYSATKAFVKSYSRALNVELNRAKNISVTTACPEWIDTDFLNVMQENNPSVVVVQYKNMKPAYEIARRAMDDALNNKDISLYGWKTKWHYFWAKILPQKWVMRYWLHQQKIK